MSKIDDEIIVLSDNDDDQATQRKSSTTTNRQSPVLVLNEPKSLSYGIERGFKLKKIHGLKKDPTSNDLMYLIEYDQCVDYEFVPSNILRRFCDEKLLIEYLENLAHFDD